MKPTEWAKSTTNNKAIIYPTKFALSKLIYKYKKDYNISHEEAEYIVNERIQPDGGYKDIIWHLFEDFGDMLVNDMGYFKSRDIFMQLKNDD